MSDKLCIRCEQPRDYMLDGLLQERCYACSIEPRIKRRIHRREPRENPNADEYYARKFWELAALTMLQADSPYRDACRTADNMLDEWRLRFQKLEPKTPSIGENEV